MSLRLVMLALQTVATHDAALECLRRAALPGQTFERRDMALEYAHKLMSLYTQQLAARNKHRGKGQQKVTVEHVHVEAGGQAIVGQVTHGAGRANEQLPNVRDHNDMSAVYASPAKPKVKRRKS